MTSNSDGRCLDELLNQHFPGKVVRKDLTKLVKEGANVPVYVLEYLLGSYCASNDETVIEEGLRTVKKVLADSRTRDGFAFNPLRSNHGQSDPIPFT